MKLVIDTVVIVRAFIRRDSHSGQLLDQHRELYELFDSVAILAEYLDVTERPTIHRKHVAAANQQREERRQRLSDVSIVSPDTIPAVCRDPGNDKFLAALEAGADYVVSEDRDLLDLNKYEGLPIVSTQAMTNVLTRRDDQL